MKGKLAILLPFALLAVLLLRMQRAPGQTAVPQGPSSAAELLVAPCCEVSSVESAAREVTARWKTTQRIVRFRLASPELAARFRVGQAVDVADAGNGRVNIRLAGYEPINGFRVTEYPAGSARGAAWGGATNIAKPCIARTVFRWIPIVFSIPILGYIYSPFENLPDYAPPTRYVFLPVMVLSGLWMWKGHLVRRLFAKKAD